MIAAVALISALLVAVGASGSSGDPLLDWLSTASGPAILAAVVFGFLKGWIVPGSEHKRVIQERDKALELVYKQAALAYRAVDVSAERLGLHADIYGRKEPGGRDVLD